MRRKGERAEKRLSCFAVAAVFVTTLHAAAGLLAHFFDEKRGATGWAGLRDRTIPQGIFAGWILAARKKRPTFSRALLDQITPAARLWTFHAQRERLGRFALGVRGTG